MFDPAPYLTALTSARTAVEIVQALRSFKSSDPEVQAKLLELYSALIDTQQALLEGQQQQSELLEENKLLKSQIAKLEAWEGERMRYELIEFSEGLLVYRLKPEQANGEPQHMLCAHCFNRGHKSLLQLKSKGLASSVFECHSCKALLNSINPSPTRNTPHYQGDWQS